MEIQEINQNLNNPSLDLQGDALQNQNENRGSTPKTSSNKSKFLIAGIFIILFIAGIVGAYFMGQNSGNQSAQNLSPTPIEDQVACTQEAKLCPDGVTSVGRTGPKCEFASCPIAAVNTSSWKTYTNINHGINIKYPSNYLIREAKSEDESYNVIFFESTSEKTEFDKCATGDGIDCNYYSLGLEFDSKNKSKTTSLENAIKNDFDEDPSNFTSLTVANYPALSNQFKGLGIVSNVYIDRETSIFHIFANSINNEDKNMNIFKSMLTTVQFTNY